MFKHIIGSLLWAVMFYAAFPFLMVAMLSVLTTAQSHHPGGRKGYLRDYYLITLPHMPGAAAFFATGVGSAEGVAAWTDWGVAAVFLACGLALYLMPSIRGAFGRLRAAARAAAAATASKAEQ